MEILLLFPGSEDIHRFSVWRNSFGSSLLFTITYFMNPSPQGPLCGGPAWRISPVGQIKYTSKPIKIQLLIMQSRSKKNYPSCLTYGDWKCCNPVLALSAAPWGTCRRCCDSIGMFSLISAWLVLCLLGIRIEAWPEPCLSIVRVLCVDELLQELWRAIFRAWFPTKGNMLLEILYLYINLEIILKRQGTHKALCHHLCTAVEKWG